MVRLPENTVVPLSLTLTDQTRPERLASTSNSHWMRPSSCLAFSFQVAPLLHVPCALTASEPLACAGPAIVTGTASAAIVAATATRFIVFMVIALLPPLIRYC